MKVEKFSVKPLKDSVKPSLSIVVKVEIFSIIPLKDSVKPSLSEVVKAETVSVMPLKVSLIDVEIFKVVALIDSLTADKSVSKLEVSAAEQR